MSQFVQAFHKGQPIASTDIAAGDDPEMRHVFYELFEDGDGLGIPYDPCLDDTWVAYPDKLQIEKALKALEKFDAPRWVEFLQACLQHDFVRLTVR